MRNSLDVLVVGAGPVGLFCANELIRHGLNCRIIDKKATLSDKSKALGIHIRTLDVFKDCGFFEPVVEHGLAVEGMLIRSQGKDLVNASFKDIPANHHFLIDLPQDKTERILYEGLQAKSLDVEWQTELLSFSEEGSTVRARVRNHAGEEEEIECSWLIACDGAHSTVRQIANMPFIGGEYQQNWWLADLFIDWKLPENRMILYLSAKGPLACFPMGQKRYRIVMTAPSQNEQDPDISDIREEFKARTSHEEAALSNPQWITKFYIHYRQVKHYRQKHVFFAGDAAHIHSPLGGQGLNTGIQDIYNLVWKLALVHKGLAKEALLDSYHEERYPIGREVLKKTDILTRAVIIKNPLAITLRNACLSFLMSFKVIKKKFIKQAAELDISYAGSPIVSESGRNKQFSAGYFLLDFSLMNMKTQSMQPLSEIVRGTKHHLLLFAGKNSADVSILADAIRQVHEQFEKIVSTHLILSHDIVYPDCPAAVWLDEKQEVHRDYAIEQPMAVLLRPDKYIGLLQLPVNTQVLIRYLKQWFIPKSQGS